MKYLREEIDFLILNRIWLSLLSLFQKDLRMSDKQLKKNAPTSAHKE